ncbi:bifunctional 4-hydroxy-2-oxoglutarate aldolase/2-dehydro-3-deoxy-phosphogluconate aldolase [Clostridium sp. C8-1-8]|uniref:bifunctional 4-hydroxy-2-oxoglutarate aldolase/2-dehydro-3-deoxy-phosphogluconate aldolase n=1 Tax=Clostridium sp. C8-1-8 TaxID=2698831 RepID=UPI00136DFBD0|nr:bifunctional 4-hydroxy-2-oxoglutarate aldolase/2-dehydro-3-deoxy-phosphogluconate aldolase [Clostridium sp. C8-1-8]
MNTILEKIKSYGVVPVVVIEDLDHALPLAEALCEAGLPIAEITFRTKEAKAAIEIIKKSFPDMLIGAGTVLNTAQVDQAIEAGAEFIISPGLNPKTLTYCRERDILMIPGCANPSDIELAIEFGLEAVKFFPAKQAGGLPMIKALSGPYSDMMFMPTGGIDWNNLEEYLSFPKVLACGGSFMVKADYMKTGDFQAIKKATREVVELVKKVRG